MVICASHYLVYTRCVQSIFESVGKSHTAQSPQDCVLPPARAGLGKGREEAEREEAGARGECTVCAGLTLGENTGQGWSESAPGGLPEPVESSGLAGSVEGGQAESLRALWGLYGVHGFWEIRASPPGGLGDPRGVWPPWFITWFPCPFMITSPSLSSHLLHDFNSVLPSMPSLAVTRSSCLPSLPESLPLFQA